MSAYVRACHLNSFQAEALQTGPSCILPLATQPSSYTVPTVRSLVGQTAAIASAGGRCACANMVPGGHVSQASWSRGQWGSQRSKATVGIDSPKETFPGKVVSWINATEPCLRTYVCISVCNVGIHKERQTDRQSEREK